PEKQSHDWRNYSCRKKIKVAATFLQRTVPSETLIGRAKRWTPQGRSEEEERNAGDLERAGGETPERKTLVELSPWTAAGRFKWRALAITSSAGGSEGIE
ncbi:hypothetical protein PoB_003953400, partial [Plakobranchus ocellatus]